MQLLGSDQHFKVSFAGRSGPQASAGRCSSHAAPPSVRPHKGRGELGVCRGATGLWSGLGRCSEHHFLKAKASFW